MTWQRMPQQRGRCKRPWVEFHKPLITMISKSVQKWLRCTRQHPESPTVSQPSQWMDNIFRLQVVDKFIYLRSTLSRAVHFDDEVTVRIAKASIAFGSHVEMSGIEAESGLTQSKKSTKLWYCQPSYICTWDLDSVQCHAKRLNHFHLSGLRKLLNIRWEDKILNTEVLKREEMQSVHTLLKLAQLRWTGHVKECLMSGYQRSSTENFSLGNASKVARRNAIKTL